MSLSKREARLQQMRDRLSDETGEETEARLQYMRDRVSDETERGQAATDENFTEGETIY